MWIFIPYWFFFPPFFSLFIYPFFFGFLFLSFSRTIFCCVSSNSLSFSSNFPYYYYSFFPIPFIIIIFFPFSGTTDLASLAYDSIRKMFGDERANSRKNFAKSDERWFDDQVRERIRETERIFFSVFFRFDLWESGARGNMFEPWCEGNFQEEHETWFDDRE